MSGIISVNGKITPPEQACIPAMDRGFLFGDNVFEVLVAFHHQILDLKPHLDRLYRSADQIDMNIPWSHEELLFEMEAMLKSLNLAKAYIRLVITRGNGLGLKTPANITPNRIIFCQPAEALASKIYTEGLQLKRKLLPFTKRGSSPKTGNYLRSIQALSTANKEGFDDILWSNSEGEITECSAANIFFIGRQGDLVEIATPPPNSGLLLGTTRAKITDLLQLSQIRVTERIVYADELPAFDEAFVCSTVKGLLPVGSIDGHRLHTLRKNAVYQHIERLYLTWAESELGYRVNWNTGKKVSSNAMA